MGNNLEKAKELAKAKTEEFKKAEATEAKTESTDAEVNQTLQVNEKAEGNKTILAEAEKQAETDARILSTKDEELSAEDKTRKAELVKAKEAKETPDDKIKKVKEDTQKRIDEVISELKAAKAERNQDKEEIARLKTELDALTKPKAEEDKATKVQNLFNQNIAKYLEEDKSKPRNERREMTKEELEEWLLEDYVEATEWLTDRNIRRRLDKSEIVQSLDEAPKKIAQEFIDKQQESVKKLIAKYPSINDPKSEDFVLVNEIVKSDPKKYLEAVDGPEQVMAELDRRKAKSTKTITLTQEELDQLVKDKVVAEAQRIANLDEGISSSGGKKVDTQPKKSEFKLKQEDIARKAGIPIEKLNEVIARREKIGVIASSAEDFNKE